MPEALAAVPRKCVQTGNSSETDGSTTARSSDDSAPDQATTTTTTSPTGTTTSSSSSRTPPSSPASQEQQQQQTANCNGQSQSRKSRRSCGRRSTQKKPLKLNQQLKTAAAINLKSQIPLARHQLIPLSPSPSSSSLTSSSLQSVGQVPSQPPTPRLALQRQNSTLQLNFRLRKSISQMDFKQARRTGNFQPVTPRRGPMRSQDTRENHQGSKDNNHNHANSNGQNHGNSNGQNHNHNHNGNSPKDRDRDRERERDKDRERDGNREPESKALVPRNCKHQPGTPMTPTSAAVVPLGLRSVVVTHSQTALVQKMLAQDDYYYVLQERDPKVAGMRIFATIMLNAWRKRRDEVKRLAEQVNDLKRGSIKAKNQLHVFNTLFRVEQKRNDELSIQLKRSLDDINHTKSSCESLTTSLISLRADKALLEQQLAIKDQEFDGLNALLTQTKSDLFKAMAQQRDLQANLSMEQRKVQMLENQKNELINEICELNNEATEKEEKLRTELEAKQAALAKAQEDTKLLEVLLEDLQEKEVQIQDFAATETTLRSEIAALQADAIALQKCLDETLVSRLRIFWTRSVNYQQATMQTLHWLAYFMLPATPPPKRSSLPFVLSLEKVLSIVKR